MARMERALTVMPNLGRRSGDTDQMVEVRTVMAEAPLREPRRRPWWLPGVVLVVLAGLVLGNRYLAPMRFDSAAIESAARTLARGGAYRVPTLDVDFRALRSAEIAAMETTPDTVLLGGSPWREVHRDLIWGATVQNAFLPDADVAGLRAIVSRLHAEDRLSRQVILLVGPEMFRDSGAVPGWALQLSPVPLVEGLVARAQGRGADGQTMQIADAQGWTLLPDGSVVPPDRVRDAEDIEMRALSAAASHAGAGPGIAPAAVAGFEALVASLSALGVEIRLVHPPVHPRFWEMVQDQPYHRALMRIEALTQEIAERQGIEVLGGFDPAVAGCDAAVFRDAFHAGPECLGTLIEPFLAPPAT